MSSDRTKTSKRKAGEARTSKWPWVALCLFGVLLVIALGISTSKPTGHGWALTLTMWVARTTAQIAGDLTMYLCFLIVLTALVKIINTDSPLPRPVWGLWTLLLCGSAFWHDARIPWENSFPMAKMGAGGGILGASIAWFLRVLLGRFGAILVIVVGTWMGLSLLVNKSPYTPFSVIWMICLTAWQGICKFFADFFRPHGPQVEAFEPGTSEQPSPEEEPRRPSRKDRADRKEETLQDASYASTVAEIREQLAKSENLRGTETRQSKPQKKAEEAFAVPMEQLSFGEEIFYDLPPTDILDESEGTRAKTNPKQIDETARRIEKTLLSFGVAAKVVHVTQGPSVTRFELQPGPGVKVSNIVNLSQDLALALAAQDIRIEAPIPGKSAIGVEVPNKSISVVHLRELIESKEFKNSPSPLTIALGKDISGRPVITSLDKCVHLLIAGATGSGKSVCINSIIASILFKARPDQVKLLLIDPKRVELSAWSRIPHLISPVVTDPKKSAAALRWAVKEMESRYERFTKVGSRDVERYNEISAAPGSARPALPYIVIVIDELSDLMIAAPAEVEDCIFRLAQMARASGIYLVVATQRPSVDVITGTIKVNIPSRIAFAVSSQVDSRTILDIGGAEKLLGRGDMLFFPVGAAKPIRAQGAYLSEPEIEKIVSFTSKQAQPQYATGVLTVPESSGQEVEMQEDPLFPQAVRIVVEAKQASVSLLQRRLPIGYSRAARLIDAMELRGFIGPYEGSKPREVKLSMNEYLRLFENPSDGNDAQSSNGITDSQALDNGKETDRTQ